MSLSCVDVCSAQRKVTKGREGGREGGKEGGKEREWERNGGRGKQRKGRGEFGVTGKEGGRKFTST